MSDILHSVARHNSGYLVGPFKTAQLAPGLLRVVEDKSGREELSAVEKHAALFSIRSCWNEWRGATSFCARGAWMLPVTGSTTVMTTLVVLMTCHNRVKKTLACLARLFDQVCPETVSISVYLVDDGSTDSTGTVVKEKFPEVNVIYGDGNLFWNRGMHRAFGEALKIGFDYYLWLNDDTLLYQNALITLLETHGELVERGKAASIIVGSMRDPLTGEFTYGGYIGTGKFINPLHLRLQTPGTEAVSCDTMCGNCVLIPKQVTDLVGNIDPAYMHRWGDVDYGLRAKAAHCESWIAPGYLADCEGNPDADRHRDHKLPFMQRLDELHSLKGLGKRDWFRFVRTHGGALWIGVWVRPYLRLIYDTFR